MSLQLTFIYSSKLAFKVLVRNQSSILEPASCSTHQLVTFERKTPHTEEPKMQIEVVDSPTINKPTQVRP